MPGLPRKVRVSCITPQDPPYCIHQRVPGADSACSAANINIFLFWHDLEFLTLKILFSCNSLTKWRHPLTEGTAARWRWQVVHSDLSYIHIYDKYIQCSSVTYWSLKFMAWVAKERQTSGRSLRAEVRQEPSVATRFSLMRCKTRHFLFGVCVRSMSLFGVSDTSCSRHQILASSQWREKLISSVRPGRRRTTHRTEMYSSHKSLTRIPRCFQTSVQLLQRRMWNRLNLRAEASNDPRAVAVTVKASDVDRCTGVQPRYWNKTEICLEGKSLYFQQISFCGGIRCQRDNVLLTLTFSFCCSSAASW